MDVSVTYRNGQLGPPGRRQEVGTVELYTDELTTALHMHRATDLCALLKLRCSTRAVGDIHAYTQFAHQYELNMQTSVNSMHHSPVGRITCRVVVLMRGLTNTVPSAKATTNNWMKR